MTKAQAREIALRLAVDTVIAHGGGDAVALAERYVAFLLEAK